MGLGDITGTTGIVMTIAGAIGTVTVIGITIADAVMATDFAGNHYFREPVGEPMWWRIRGLRLPAREIHPKVN